MLIYGQQADLYGLAMNPAYPHVFATVCESDKVIIFNAVTNKVRARLRLLPPSTKCWQWGVLATSHGWRNY